MTELLVDADLLVYKCAAGVERTIEYEPNCFVLMSYKNDAAEAFDETLRSLVDQSGCDSYLLCFSHKDNFRKSLYPEYKANRKNTRRPLCWKDFTDHVKQTTPPHQIISRDRLEADDVIGILATQRPEQYIIWSEDKDLRQIPGKHLTSDGVTLITREQADYAFYLQTLTGDTADNYPGCPGIGPKRAEDILREKPYWPRVVAAYAKSKLTEADAVLQAQVARILRASDWDSDKQEPILWQPTIA